MLDVPDNVLLLRLEAYGRDARINDGGHFAPGGYVFNNGGNLWSGITEWRTFPRSTASSLSQAEYPGADGGLQGGP